MIWSKCVLYRPEALAMADTISQAELRTALLIKMAGQGKPRREQLVLDLIKLAGGLDEAFSAAFGPKAGQFFLLMPKSKSQFTRRKFSAKYCCGRGLSNTGKLCSTT